MMKELRTTVSDLGHTIVRLVAARLAVTQSEAAAKILEGDPAAVEALRWAVEAADEK